jgi:hypothetical protein
LKPETNKIPIVYHIFYLLLAGALAYLYYKKIVLPTDPDAPNSINAVASLETAKPYQFRLLIPFIFILFKPLTFVPQKLIYFIYTVIITYSIIIVYKKILTEYFRNKTVILLCAPVILYPMLWNYIILNQSYQYYDFTAILIFSLGIYFIIKDNFKWLLIVLTLGIFNKETSGYLVFAYILFNYKILFTKKIIFSSALLIAVYMAIKIALNYIFRNNTGDPIEFCMYENINIIKTFTTNKIYMKHILLSFGAMYVFLFLLFLTGRWKLYLPHNLVFINLAFFPNIIIGFFVTYFDEVRVYAEFIPLITTSFLVYLGTFKKLKFMQA